MSLYSDMPMHYITFGDSGHDIIESPVAVGLFLVIFSDTQNFAVVQNLWQLSWHAAVQPILTLQQQLACRS
jgi:hypothetical protein